MQFIIERLLSSDAPSEELPDEDEEESGDSMKLTSIQSITDFMNCAGRTLPDLSLIHIWIWPGNKNRQKALLNKKENGCHCRSPFDYINR